jgi:predicted NodU family carbamoyl transferase
MYILGLNIGPHDASAALLKDGALRVLIEQERVSRKKHAIFESPARALRACLEAEGISMASVDRIAFGWDLGQTVLGSNRRFTPDGIRRWLLPDLAPDAVPPLSWVPHHLAHAASGYYSSGADQAAIIVVDGAGERQATSLARGRDGKIEILREWPISQSLGFYYGLAAQWSGLHLHFGPGKLMGLAAYGRPRPGLSLAADPACCYSIGATAACTDTEPAADDVAPIRLEIPRSFERAVTAEFGQLYPFAPRGAEDAISYADFAASVQAGLEEAILALAAEARHQMPAATLVLAGGVAMNCSMIGRLVRSGIFEHVYVPPVPTDAGVSLGGALVEAARHSPFNPVVIDHAYWANDITADEAAAAAGAAGLVFTRLGDADLARNTARAVADGKIVGWARGRGEIGQRALGARSIIADPRDRGNLARLNLMKGREMWRPVAPSVLAERTGELMAAPPGHPARFMLSAGAVSPGARTRAPATTHVDGSARPQVVERSANPVYWDLIERFRRLTGIPAVVNTSFNLAGEPIVATAADAVATFTRSELDVLVLGNLLAARSEADLAAAVPALARSG